MTQTADSSLRFGRDDKGEGGFLGSIPAPGAGCPTSRSFREMWDTAGLPSNLLRIQQIYTGALRSHQRTWAENDRRSFDSFSFRT
jgi:hypothetical protein